MKSISNLSHAKAVHAVKCIGKVLLPVALLLAAILCMSVFAGAADAEKIGDGSTGKHLVYENGTPKVEDCTPASHASCAEELVCSKCGGVYKNANKTDHDMTAEVAADRYLAKAGKCEADSTYYVSCKNCGKGGTNTFQGKKHNYVNKLESAKVNKKDVSYLVAEPTECGQPYMYWMSCACGASAGSEENPDESLQFTNGKTKAHTAAKYEIGLELGNKNAAETREYLLKSAGTCTTPWEYYNYCSVCKAKLSSYTTIEGDHTYAKYYNSDAHFEACEYCGAVKAGTTEAHSYEDGAEATCTKAVTCTKCDYVRDAKLGHDYKTIAAVPATCDTDGTVQYYQCKTCKKYFAKKDGKNATTSTDGFVDKALGHQMAEGAPLCNPGKCTVCGETLTATEQHTYKDADSKNCLDKCTVCGTQRRAKHTYEKTVYNKATCTTEGSYNNVCKDCGAKEFEKDQVIPATDHNWDGTPNCFTYVKCKNCNKEIKQHTLPEGFDENNVKCNATIKCDVCDKVLYNGATEHSWKTVSKKDATCEEDGYTAGTYCKHEITINLVEVKSDKADTAVYETKKVNCTVGSGYEKIEKLGHTWNSGKVTTAATCVSKGTMTYTCTRKDCGKTKTEEIAIDKDAHKWSTNYYQSTTTHWKTCLNGCGTTTSEAAHEYHYTTDNGKTWIDSDGPVCVYNAVCKTCGFVAQGEDEHVDAKGNQAKINYTYTDKKHTASCAVCGTVLEKDVAHDMKDVAKKDANCGNDGYSKHKACVCGYTTGKTVTSATGKHKYGEYYQCDKNGLTKDEKGYDKATDGLYHTRKCETCGDLDTAKCTSDNAQNCTTASRCTVCGDTMKKNNGKGTITVAADALGHVISTETTVTETAHSWTCTREGCGLVIEEKHTSDAKAVCQDGKCVCGATVKATKSHSYGKTPVKGDDGVSHYYVCSKCGDKKVETCTFDSVVVDDCTKGIKCTKCDNYLVGSATGTKHDMSVLVEAKAATCTEDGYTQHRKCKNCNTTVGKTVIEATGHKYGEGVVTTPATSTTAGVMTYSCTVCGATKTEVIPVGGEKPVASTNDANGDGKFDTKDAIALLKYCFNPEKNPLAEGFNGDVNGDGKINTQDAVALLKAYFKSL